jgi:predicted glycosyltransferase involved in capsule biosynthesis
MVRSCNFSIYFNDLIKISGFDEQYIGWGREDSDLIIRLLKAGLKVRSARLAACVGHLHHRETPNTMRSPNEHRFVEVLAGKTCSSKSTSVLMHQ